MKRDSLLAMSVAFACSFFASATTWSADNSTLVARWSFGTEETTALTAHGGVHRDQPGPRSPEFPDFDAQNTAVKLDGDGAYFSFADPGAESNFDFTNGDAITLEAWVNVETIRSGENRYIIGKGRTETPGFARDNQNWALRVRETDGTVRVSFLFATPHAPGNSKSDKHWHRWTTTEGFLPGSGWHHLAVTYRFGEPDSVRGWLDGKKRDGQWDMGGPTKEPPVVDDDAIWIGSSLGGKPGNSLKGWLDEMAIHRVALSDDVLKSRFRREGPMRPEPTPLVEAPPQLPALPPGHVLVLCHENLAAHDRWLNSTETLPPPVARWDAPGFFFPRLPFRYDDWGIREGWQPPVLLQAAADVSLAAGKHRFVMRTRGLSRLWVNGTVVARTKAHGGSSDGHEPVHPTPEPPVPGHRPVGFGDQEVFGELELPAAGKYRVILETLIGGKKLRAEPGEMLVAVQSLSHHKLPKSLETSEVFAPFVVLQSADSGSPPLTLSETDFFAAQARAEASLTTLDDLTRRAAASSQVAFWQRRHELARDWAHQHPAPAVPNGAAHPVDAFLVDKVARARAASVADTKGEAKQFHETVLPILRDHCFRCHGDKVKGGLRLNTLAAALKGGESGEAAVVPNDPAASQLLLRVKSTDESQRMPPSGEGLKPEQIAMLEAWIKAGANWPAPPVSTKEITAAPRLDDAAFLRRVTLDTIGLPPREADVRQFLVDATTNKRERMIDLLLDDNRFADHWVSYWQDVLAENPNMLKPSLNNSGPFRYYLYEALRDNRRFDQLVTDLIMQRGSEREGGSAGFGLAADNDAPFAAKGHILATAFLGVELQCARCHDSPYHSTKQRDLFSLAAMLARKTVTVPKTSTVALGFFEKNKGRESLIQVTLKPGEPIAPQWPFAKSIATIDAKLLASMVRKADDSREQLAAFVTAPQNERFAQVIVNRVWKRLMGAGMVEPAHDWEGRVASHPELLQWLAHDFVSHGYDLRQLVRRIVTSETYQRVGSGQNLAAAAEKRFFVAPEQRRLSAEQVVDSLFAAVEQRMEVEEITFDPEGKRPANSMINLGAPSRAWMFASLSNERDRPSLSLPRAQMVTDVLEAFGWTAARQSPRTDRETDPTVLQPGVLSNSVVVTWISRASAQSALAQLAVDAPSPESLVDSIFIRFLGRLPTAAEQAPYVVALGADFAKRLIPADEVRQPTRLPPLSRVSWSNHLVSEANNIKLEMERRARAGSPPDPRLRTAWREVYEDFVWSIINTPEFVWMP